MRRRFAGLLLAAGLAVTACGGSTLPGEARTALSSYWASLPSDPGIEHRITRVWQGEIVTEQPGTPPSEIWCVEAEMSSPDPAVDGTPMVWIVTRTDEDPTWSAALLATLSAAWPYEACGTPIGSPG